MHSSVSGWNFYCVLVCCVVQKVVLFRSIRALWLKQESLRKLHELFDYADI
jgi:hypothetical protein